MRHDGVHRLGRVGPGRHGGEDSGQDSGEDSMDEVTVGLAALERTPLFAGLDREHLEAVLRVGHRVAFDPGQVIVDRGDPGDAMYIMLSGAAEVDVGGRFHRLQRGDFFGEMAVLAGKPREATVKAVEPVEALRIPADDFQAFLVQHPQVAVGMLKSLVERLREVQDRLDTWIGGVW
jgi:CRP-like cAMP-binding protein